MKKTILFLFAAALAVCLCACSPAAPSASSSSAPALSSHSPSGNWQVESVGYGNVTLTPAQLQGVMELGGAQILGTLGIQVDSEEMAAYIAQAGTARLALQPGGTGTLSFTDAAGNASTEDITWAETGGGYTLQAGGESAPLTYNAEGDTLTLTRQDITLTLQRA